MSVDQGGVTVEAGAVQSRVRGGGYGPGELYRCDGYRNWTPVRWSRDCRSRSGRSGFVAAIVTEGLYVVRGAALGSRSRGDVVFAVDAAGAARPVDNVEAEMSARDPEGAARVSGLPALVGSPRQIAWADDIRRRVARARPDASELTDQASASWWIDNRARILADR